MRDPTPHFADLVQILNIESKRDLVRHCRSVTIYQQDLVALILGAQHGVFAPYRYANHFARRVPDHLNPSDAEQAAIAESGRGAYKNRSAAKFASKVFQLFREQRSLAAHLLYTPNNVHWHLFYFDNRDTADTQNHWKNGSHIHYVSNLWPELSLQAVWKQVTSGSLGFQGKLHLRYRARYSGA